MLKKKMKLMIIITRMKATLMLMVVIAGDGASVTDENVEDNDSREASMIMTTIAIMMPIQLIRRTATVLDNDEPQKNQQYCVCRKLWLQGLRREGNTHTHTHIHTHTHDDVHVRIASNLKSTQLQLATTFMVPCI